MSELKTSQTDLDAYEVINMKYASNEKEATNVYAEFGLQKADNAKTIIKARRYLL